MKGGATSGQRRGRGRPAYKDGVRGELFSLDLNMVWQQKRVPLDIAAEPSGHLHKFEYVINFGLRVFINYCVYTYVQRVCFLKRETIFGGRNVNQFVEARPNSELY